jgi:glutamate-1-semialdehyde 2,1-aminomutase
MPAYSFTEDRFFRSDGAPPDVAERRRQSFERLSQLLTSKAPITSSQTAALTASMSDLHFTSHYRVPFQFRELVGRKFQSATLLRASTGVLVEDLDGGRDYDLAGSYGVNLLGYDFYKVCIDRGIERVRDLGPLLGSYHPLVQENVDRLKEISGLDEVSFHMSGTEAIMQAVRLARFHTGCSHLVRFCGAYHGWWDDVQPGPGNPSTVHATYTLKDMSREALRVLATRNDIACVLVNPLQALHPNAGAPSDGTLIDSSRCAGADRERYAVWLKELRHVCTKRGIVLILDEIFVGFRIARGGAQEYFGVAADMVTYGKTVGGGLPIGVLCGTSRYMKRFRDDYPSDFCFARGTFNSHPYVMGAMHEFLRRFDEPEVRVTYDRLDATWNARAARLNAQLEEASLPVRVANLVSIWTVFYTMPSRYNWMFQYYLRSQRLYLSWIGTGRLIFSHNYSDADVATVCDRFVDAARTMRHDGWWWREPALTNRSIRRQVLRETLAAWVKPVLPGAHAGSSDAIGSKSSPRTT